MLKYCTNWLFALFLSTIFFLPGTIYAQNLGSNDKYYIANTEPPDDFLSLRSEPTTKSGRRITKMNNGTAVEVLQKSQNGWWQLKIINTGEVGWALSASNNKQWIVCCLRSDNDPIIAENKDTKDNSSNLPIQAETSIGTSNVNQKNLTPSEQNNKAEEYKAAEIVVLYDSRSKSRDISKNLDGELEIAVNVKRESFCFDYDLEQIFYKDPQYAPQYNPTGRNPNLEGYFEYFNSQLRQKFPKLQFSAPVGNADCAFELYTDLNSNDYKNSSNKDDYFKPIIFIQRYRLSHNLPREVQEVLSISFKDFEENRKKIEEQIESEKRSSSLRLEKVIDGSITGAGIISLIEVTKQKHAKICGTNEEIGLWHILFQKNKNLSDKFNTEYNFTYFQNDLNTSFKKLKSGECDSFIGKAETLSKIVKALKREGFEITLDNNWIDDVSLSSIHAQLDEALKKQQEAEAAKIAAAEAKQKEEEQCNASEACRAIKKAQEDAAIAARKAQLPPFRAILKCILPGNQVTATYFCIWDSRVGGRLEITNNNVQKVYSLNEIAMNFRNMPDKIDLSEHFNIYIQTNDNQDVTLDLQIIDRDDKVIFQRQANGFKTIAVRN